MKVGDIIYTRIGAVRMVDFQPVGEAVILSGEILRIDPKYTASYQVEFDLDQLAGYDDYNMLKRRARRELDADGVPTGKLFSCVEVTEVFQTRKDAAL